MTINGKGILPPGHELALSGNLGMAPLRAELEASDVVLAVGTEFGETEMYPEPHPLIFGGRLIRIDIDPLQLTTAVPSALAITADAKLACAEFSLRCRHWAGQRSETEKSELKRCGMPWQRDFGLPATPIVSSSRLL